ncbi:MAG: hypothetical protein RBT71_04905 [Flavobacteriales bacterium]|jgi:hypothetical protein|nr:hypothetical protein [Flavobacteriales bacterium]
MLKKWGPPTVLIAAGLVLLVSGLVARAGPWALVGAGLTMLAGVLALLLAMGALDRRKGLMLGAALLLATLLLGWRNMRSVARSAEFAEALAEHDAMVVQSLKDVRTVQLGYRQTHGEFAGDLATLRDFVAHGHVPVVFKATNTPPVDSAAGGTTVRHDTAWVPAMEQLFGLSSAQHDRRFPFDPATFATVPGTGQDLLLRAGTIDRDGVLVPVFEAKEPDPWTAGDTLTVGSMHTPTLEGSWTDR